MRSACAARVRMNPGDTDQEDALLDLIAALTGEGYLVDLNGQAIIGDADRSKELLETSLEAARQLEDARRRGDALAVSRP